MIKSFTSKKEEFFMKKILAFFILLIFICPISEINAITSKQNIQPPKWEDYVPTKYQDPKPFPNKGKNITELSVGIFLTDLILTSPIGIPMIYHATTKLKNDGWYKRKQKFEQGLIEAEKISDPAEKQQYYDKLLRECKLIKK